MKIRRIVALVLISLLTCIPCFAQAPPEHHVAIVGDIPITSYELKRHMDKILPFNVNYHGSVTVEKMAQIKEKALQDLITRTYKVCYAKEKGLVTPQDKMSELSKKIDKKFSTRDELNKALGKETLAELKVSYENTLLAKQAEEHAVDSKVSVTEADIQNYYDNNKDHFFHPKQFRASHILVKVDPAATEDVRFELLMKAESLKVRAKAGEDFYNLAYYNSDDRTSFVGGDMGMINQGQAVKPIDNALSKLKVGEISDVVETLVGFHILKLTQVIEPRQMTLKELEEKIRFYLENEQRDPLYEEWMATLKETYKLQRFEKPKE